MKRGKFIVTDIVPEGFIREFEDLGFEVDYFVELSNEKLADIIPAYEGIVVNTHIQMDRAMIARAALLKYILRPGSGLDNIDVAFAEENGILVLNSPEANKDAVAEHAIGLLLGLLNFIPRAAGEVRSFQWRRQANMGTEIKGKVIGIIGFGNTGSALARKLQGFEAELLVYDKYKKDFGIPYIRETGMDEIFERADILSLHIPLDENTLHLVDAAYLRKFRKPVYLINTSRGRITDLVSVAEALREGLLLGAALDVLENERLAAYTEQERAQLDFLFASGNVIVTPHIAGWTHEARIKIFMMVLDKFRQVLNGPS